MPVARRRILHVHECGCSVDGGGGAAVQHEEAIRETVVVHIRIGEVLLILVDDLAHFGAELLGVGVTAADGAPEEVAALGRGALLAVSVHGHLAAVGAGAGAAVHLADEVRPIHELARVAHAAVDGADALRTVVAARG